MRTQTNTAFLYTNVSFQEDLLELEVLRVQVFPEDPGALFSSMTESSHCHPGTPPGGGTFLHTLNETTMIWMSRCTFLISSLMITNVEGYLLETSHVTGQVKLRKGVNKS